MSLQLDPERAVILRLALKGGRSYVRGADVVSELLGRLGLSAPVVFRFQRLTDQELDVTPLTPTDRAIDCVATLSAGAPPEQVNLKITERKGGAPLVVEAFDEDAIVRDATIEGTRAWMTCAGDQKLADCLVALNKRLLNAQSTGKLPWVLTGLQLQSIPAMAGGVLSLAINPPFMPRLVRSSVVYNGHTIGSILFAAARS